MIPAHEIDVSKTYSILETATLLNISMSGVVRLLRNGHLQETCAELTLRKKKFVTGASVALCKKKMIARGIEPQIKNLWVTLPEAAVILGTSIDWVRSELKKGRFEKASLLIGKRQYLSKRALEEYLNAS